MFMRFRELFILFLYLSSLFLTGMASAAGDYVISPTGAHNDQEVINAAIKAVSESGGGTVYLKAGVYLVNGPVIIKSNIKLTGDPDAIIRVSPTSSQWFTGQNGVISNPEESLRNVEICGFQIDGNIKNLPREYDSTQGHKRDCEKLILIGGWSNNFAKNIQIHHMRLYNAFSDGIYLRFTTGAAAYSNIISNCQHEGIYFSCVVNGIIRDNNIAGITSDCARLDNCVDCKVHDNLFFSYNGDTRGAWAGGENGLQIGDSGVSHGYDGRNKPLTTTNIEVFNNTFADPGLRAIWLHEGKNVFIHDNKFIDAAVLETMGIPVGDISLDNMPSLEISEDVFDSLLDILNFKFYDTGHTNQTAENIYVNIEERDHGLIRAGVAIAGFSDVVYVDDVPYIPDNNSVIVKSVAIPSPAFSFGIAGKVEQETKAEIKEGKAYATLTVKMNYVTQSRNAKGKYVTKIRTVKEDFEAEPVPAPAVLPRPTQAAFRIDQYTGGVKNYTTVAPAISSEGLQRIEYEYDGKVVKHVFAAGEQIKDDKGIIHTNLTEVNYWDGELSHLGKGAYIEGEDFDQAKLKIRAYTIYEEIPTKSEYELHEYQAKRLLDIDSIIVLLKILAVMLALFSLLKMIY